MKRYMSNKEMFEKVREHLLTQKDKASSLKDGICRYRADDGKKCAVGCLIPDDAYTPAIEGSDVTRLFAYRDIIRKARISPCKASLALLRGLQNIHDDIAPEHWRKALEALGRSHGFC